MPCRYSTTTPSARRSSPHTFSTSSASCRPSTKIRLARAVRARASATAKDPDAVRRGPCGCRGCGRRHEDDVRRRRRGTRVRAGTAGGGRADPRARPCPTPRRRPRRSSRRRPPPRRDPRVASTCGKRPRRAAAAIPRRAHPCRSDRPCVLRIGKATAARRAGSGSDPHPPRDPARALPCPAQACIDSREGRDPAPRGEAIDACAMGGGAHRSPDGCGRGRGRSRLGDRSGRSSARATSLDEVDVLDRVRRGAGRAAHRCSCSSDTGLDLWVVYVDEFTNPSERRGLGEHDRRCERPRTDPVPARRRDRRPPVLPLGRTPRAR